MINSEQIQALRARYAEPETPNCRICGAKMSIQRAGGGSLVYGCDGRVEGDGYVFKEGRDFADKHYEQSRETVYNMGDADVMALLAERDADKSLIAESVLLFETLRQRIAELEQKHCGGALMKREEHHVGVVNKLLERIAELEGALNLASASYAGERERADALQARTVKLPESFTKSMYGTPLYEHVDIVAMLAAAGITLDVGDERWLLMRF